MKKFNPFYTITFIVAFLSLSCKTTKEAAVPEGKKFIDLICKMEGCTEGKDLRLYQFDGMSMLTVQVAKADANNTFTFKVPKSENQYYFVGENEKQTKPIILGKEKSITLTGNCKNMRASKMEGSPLNVEYEKAIGQIRGYQTKANGINRQLSRIRDGAQQQKFITQLKENDANQLALYNDMKAKYPFVAKVVGTKMYMSYPNNKGNYPNELEYYLNEFFRYTDLTDKELSNMPALFETFRDYTITLIAVKFDTKKIQSVVNPLLEKINPESKAYRYALGGVIGALQQKNHPAFASFGKIYIEKYKAENAPYMVGFIRKVEDAKRFMVGSIAPDFEQPTPEGNPLKLSDLRGKVVLVDFWASWCGPCRKENPHVVKLYDKYKAKGFDVMGVSLDKTKDRWVKAIEKDGLKWNHVSDLKGWSNVVAKQYSVSSIPHTLLLDKDGKILARNLRSKELAVKLKEIFGE